MLEVIMHSKKTKYTVLDQIFKKYVKPDAENINFFIDVESVLKSVYQPKTMEIFNSLNVNEKWLISSEIINLASHYRHYTYSRLGKYSTFYFFHSSEVAKSLVNIYPEYKSEFYGKHIKSNPNFENINKIVQKNLQASKLICEYLPHVYFINTLELEPNVVPYHFIKEQEATDMSVVLTNDPVLYQSTLFNPSTIIMTMKGDDSRIIESDDIINELLAKAKKKPEVTIVPDFYTNILAMSGWSKYKIKGLDKYGALRSTQSIIEWVKDGHLSNMRYDDPSVFTEALDVILPDTKRDIIERNFNLLDIPTIHRNISMKRKIEVLDDAIINRIDAKQLRYMNDRYYNRYPLILEYLMEGESYE
jgi:hypothetical protein